MNFEIQLPPILDLCLKSSAILFAAFVVAWVARRASAARRHLVWLAAFVALALLPLALTIPPRWSWSWQPPAPLRPAVLTTPPTPSQDLPDPPAEVAFVRPAFRLPGWPEIAGGAWLGGALLLLGRQAAGFWKLRGVRLGSSAITSGLPTELAAAFRVVEMRESPMCAVPFTWGWLRPVVVLPASASSWPEMQLRAALAHEFGHIARSDFVWRQLAQIVRAFFWPNPLVWFAVQALHRTQEQACDDLVLRRGASPREYAMQLLEATRALAVPMRISPQALAMALPSALEARVRAIVDQHRDRSTPSHWSRLWAAAAIIAVIASSAVAQMESSPPEAPAAPQVLSGHCFLAALSLAGVPAMQVCSTCHQAAGAPHDSDTSPNLKAQQFQTAFTRYGFLAALSLAGGPPTQVCSNCHQAAGATHDSDASPNLKGQRFQTACTHRDFLAESSHASVPATQVCSKCHQAAGTTNSSQHSPRALFPSGFLPTIPNGVRFRNQGDPVLNVSSPDGVDPRLQRDTLDRLASLNQERLGADGDPELPTRIATYERAFKLQAAASE
jgi:cytochrome c553